MKRVASILSVGVVMFSLFGKAMAKEAEAQGQNAYDFSFSNLIRGEPLPLSAYRGKVLLVVNTASQCGFTSQYAGLQTLYDTYKDRGLMVIGVPSNDFGAQEPGSAESIAEFCKLNYGVSFPMTQKEHVVGDKAHPFYVWAAAQKPRPKWNFHKYLIGRDGRLIDYFHSTTAPDADTLKRAIGQALAAGS